MISLKSVMSSPVISVTPESPISDAVALMGHHNISAIVVVNNQFPVGIFTERSLLHLVTSVFFDPTQPIKETIFTKPITCIADADIHEAYLLFLHHNIRHMIVVDEQGMLAGIATETDLLQSLGLEYFVSFDNLKKISTKNVISLKKDDSVVTAMQLMRKNNISSIVIEENLTPIGIITERDIVHLIRDETDLHSTSLQEVMTHPVQTASAMISTHSAAEQLRKNRIRRLVITDKDDHLAGIVTETDILKGLQSGYITVLKEVIENQVVQLRNVRKQLNDKIILESMMESATDIAFVITDLNYKILHSNKTAEALFGYSLHDANQIGIPTLFQREGGNPEHLEQAIAHIHNKGKFSYTHSKQTGSKLVYIEFNIFGINGKDKDIQGYVLIATDITEHVEINQHLTGRNKEIEEKNAALRVLLKQREIDKEENSQIFQQNVEQLVLPFFSKLRKSDTTPEQENILQSIESNLRQINSPFAHRISNIFSKLTPAEIQVANLIKNGHSSKEIASLLNLSDKTIYTHRRNIRKKSDITNQKVNLQTILQQLE